jgi:hypothetical protein
MYMAWRERQEGNCEMSRTAHHSSVQCIYLGDGGTNAIIYSPDHHPTPAYTLDGMEGEAGRQLLNVLNSTPQPSIMYMSWREREERTVYMSCAAQL